VRIDDWPSTYGRDQIYRELKELGLVENLAEFDTFGFTVIPPEKVGMQEEFSRMRERVLELAGERTGVEHSIDGEVQIGKLRSIPQSPNQFVLYYLLTEDAAFRTAVTNPVVRLFLHTVLGSRFHLSSCTAFVKSKGDAYGPGLGLHADVGDFPEPLPGPGTYSHGCNTNWLLTDYLAEHGPLCVVPGSHRWCRLPRDGEGIADVVPVEGRAGSVIVFHGNLWHGGLPRQTDGLRLSVNAFFARPYAMTQENYRGRFSPEVLETHGEWFAQLVGERSALGWEDGTGPDPDKYLRGSVIL
jgi:ectoine hydroxylase-related dioxygenase (phytanoyl-CoA dioxygenase family)